MRCRTGLLLAGASLLTLFVAVKTESKEGETPSRSDRGGDGHVEYTYATACFDTFTSKYHIQGAKCREQQETMAASRYSNKVHEQGFGILEVETSGTFADQVAQAYFAGFLEAHLVKDQIEDNYQNSIAEAWAPEIPFHTRLIKFLQLNLDWMASEVENNVNDLYWRHVKLIFAQLTGMADCYNGRTPDPHVDFVVDPIYMLQISGDLFDLGKFLKKDRFHPFEYPESASGTAFVKLTPGNKDLLVGHVKMGSSNTMNRVLKLYKLGYAKTISFSGYPGALSSCDDFTLTSGGLASVSTSINIFKEEIYKNEIRPEGHILSWLRARIANSMSTSAKAWKKQFELFNSGTGNAQWIIVDYKRFTPGEPLNRSAITIVEQAPLYVHRKEMTWYVNENSYFPSYNIPYLKFMKKYTGYDIKEESFDWYKWDKSPRANIIHRDHYKVVEIDSLTKFMRYNDYLHDEFALCECSANRTAEAGISSRGDLNPDGEWQVAAMGSFNHMGIDFKGTNFEMFRKLRFRAWAGPTYDPLPPFDWRTARFKPRHEGQPDIWNFTYFDLVWEADTEVKGMN